MAQALAPPATSSVDDAPDLLKKLTAPGVLGIFNHVEVTSVIATHKTSKRTISVLTHLVTVEHTELKTSPESLRKSHSPSCLIGALALYDTACGWTPCLPN